MFIIANEEIGSLIVRIEANVENLSTNMNRAAERIEDFDKKTASMADKVSSGFHKIIGAAAALGAAAGGWNFLKGTIADASEAQAKLAQLDAVIKSTGGAAGVTAEQASELADALEKTTKFAAETTLDAENMLLTFTNIGSNVFPEATRTVMDMAQALGTDAAGQAMQLGKAINDPINGISALTRVGVTFTEEQKNLIKSLQESGDIAGAQKVILAELSKEFGGSAEAAGKTFAGQLAILKNQIGAVTEKIGVALMPTLSKLMTSFSKLLSGDSSPAEFGDQLSSMITEAVDSLIEKLPDFLESGYQMLSEIGKGIMSALPKITKAGFEIVSQLVTAFVRGLPDLLETGLQVIEVIIKGITDNLPNLIRKIPYIIIQIVNTLAANIPALVIEGMAMLQAIADGILKAIPQLIAALPEMIDNIVSYINEALPSIIEIGVEILLALIDGIVKAIPQLVAALPQIIKSIINGLLLALPQIIQAGVTLLTALVKAMPEIINAIVNALPQIIDAIVISLTSDGGENLSKIIQAGVDLLIALVNNIGKIIEVIINALPQIISAIVTALTTGDNLSKIIDAGVQLFIALISNIGEIISIIVNKLPQIIDSIITELTKEENLKKMEEAGIKLAQALLKGIDKLGLDPLSGLRNSLLDQADKLKKELESMLPKTPVTGFGTGNTRASGGPVLSDTSYLVGEKGPEIFTPKTNGTIIPADQTKSILNSSANFEGMITGNTFIIRGESDIKALAREFYNLTQGTMRAGGTA